MIDGLIGIYKVKQQFLNASYLEYVMNKIVEEIYMVWLHWVSHSKGGVKSLKHM